MYYLDSRRLITRRDSSLILPHYTLRENNPGYDTRTLYGQSTACTISESGTSNIRSNGSVQKEIVTLLFESMLDNIVESWVVIERRHEDTGTDLGKTSSELTLMSKKKKSAVKTMKLKRSRSKVEVFEGNQQDTSQQCWWASPDERAIIKFRNGNIYEGHISMKCMDGEGRFQWSDGTVYMGHFQNNEIRGKGAIQWKDDTWYEGDFTNNLRHGKGLYVDSRQQCSYSGHWDRGTKHGDGVIYYSNTFQNSYDGEWSNNVRHGFGSREYSRTSGYRGDWADYIREGKGLMIWPNRDFYRGQWKNNVMSGHGVYIWNAYCSNSMSSPSMCAYHGSWEQGKRQGYGVLNFGLGLGSYYKGEFKKNKKHGAGKLVTNNGLILRDRSLFVDDNIGKTNEYNDDSVVITLDYRTQVDEPYNFDMCNKLGLLCHIQQAFRNIDRQIENRNQIINDYLMDNRKIEKGGHKSISKSSNDKHNRNFRDIFDFEISSLHKALMCYETVLKNIYYQYATICNTEEIHFSPVLIRLYLWQLYYDCNIHEKGLTLSEIDKIFYTNPDWLARTQHDPFEEIYFWQFLHSLISVANHLYSIKYIPDKKPDTIVASAFRVFMENDILPGVGRRKGNLVNGYGKIVPLRGLYQVYLSLGKQSTVRTFLAAVRYPPHEERTQCRPIDCDVELLGINSYIYENKMFFTSESHPPEIDISEPELKLFNFNNVPTASIIKIFSMIFPQVYQSNKIVNLMIELSFFEFFEAFIECAQESVRLTDRDNVWTSLHV